MIPKLSLLLKVRFPPAAFGPSLQFETEHQFTILAPLDVLLFYLLLCFRSNFPTYPAPSVSRRRAKTLLHHHLSCRSVVGTFEPNASSSSNGKLIFPACRFNIGIANHAPMCSSAIRLISMSLIWERTTDHHRHLHLWPNRTDCCCESKSDSFRVTASLSTPCTRKHDFLCAILTFRFETKWCY